eukprot:1974224-Amphidinium_carterae.1
MLRLAAARLPGQGAQQIVVPRATSRQSARCVQGGPTQRRAHPGHGLLPTACACDDGAVLDEGALCTLQPGS